MPSKITLGIALFLVYVHVIESKKILLLPACLSSHVYQHNILGKRLVDDGHQVYMGICETFPFMSRFTDSPVKLIIHKSPEVDNYNMDKERKEDLDRRCREGLARVPLLRRGWPEILHTCTNPLGDIQYRETIKAIGFDLVIGSLAMYARCLLIIPYDLGIPYLGMTAHYEPWLSRSPVFPSIYSSHMHGTLIPERMTFWERLINVWNTVDWIIDPRLDYLSDSVLQVYIKEKPPLSLNEITGKCLLFFSELDFLMDYLRPLMPNEVNVGGLTVRDAKRLPQELQHFMDTADHGVILLTFGSSENANFDSILVDKFMDVFSHTDLKVLIKHNEAFELNVGKNVKVMEWLPQNDVLGHPNLKIFITHCGGNGQMEALYHGVPMIGIPQWSDQFHNCKRMEHHGYGICLNPIEFTSTDLSKAIDQLMVNYSFTAKIKHASNIFRARPMSPVELGCYWINHVMTYGGAHLRSHALDMPWYQYLMLDVIAFMLVVAAFSVLSICCLVNQVLRYGRDVSHMKTD